MPALLWPWNLLRASARSWAQQSVSSERSLGLKLVSTSPDYWPESLPERLQASPEPQPLLLVTLRGWLLPDLELQSASPQFDSTTLQIWLQANLRWLQALPEQPLPVLRLCRRTASPEQRYPAGRHCWPQSSVAQRPATSSWCPAERSQDSAPPQCPPKLPVQRCQWSAS